MDNVTKTVKYLLCHLTRTTHSSPLPLLEPSSFQGKRALNPGCAKIQAQFKTKTLFLDRRHYQKSMMVGEKNDSHETFDPFQHRNIHTHKNSLT